MQAVNTLFVKVVAQPFGRDFMLLCSFEEKVTQRTAINFESLTNVTQNMIDNAIIDMLVRNNASDFVDVTHISVQKMLVKAFAQ